VRQKVRKQRGSGHLGEASSSHLATYATSSNRRAAVKGKLEIFTGICDDCLLCYRTF
jgi:hypothetical protein